MDDSNYQTGASPRRDPANGRMSVWLLFYVVAVALVASENALAGPCDAPVLNPIVCENSRPGNPATEWDIGDDGDASIQGFATDISVNQGETVRFKIDTDASAYRIDIYRLGYYNGMGARFVDTVLPTVVPQIQPPCLSDIATGLIDCGNWGESAAWTVPGDATSGVYFAKPVREDGTPGTSHIVFVVRDDNGASGLLFQTSDTTWQAYNDYGGNSLYVGAPAGRAYKVSYNRPFSTRRNQFRRAWLFGAEYPMVRWIEASGYNVSYVSGVDSDRSAAELLEHAAFLSVGHDEYWSAAQRANVEAARDAGVHLAFFSGNEVFWKTRWESSIDGSGTPYRTLVSYKETHANAKIDPLPNIWTGTWRDPRFSPPADGGRPENELTGTIFAVNCCQDALSITVPAAYSRLRFWRNTGVAALAPGQVATLPRGVLGYEWDEPLNNGYAPVGLVKLSSTTVNEVPYLQDHGSTYGPGTATHSLTVYRHSGGALVFGAGTIRWSWGLDGNHDFDIATPSASTTADERMQQATVNLFADMGVQPGTLQAGLVAATQSTDVTPPASIITDPPTGSTVVVGQSVTIAGTAADSGGGVVAVVEVSVDGGTTWRFAPGTESWTYSWVPAVSGSVTLKSRGIDDSGNIEVPGAGTAVTVSPRVCPCSLWDDATVPAVPSDLSDSNAQELGVKFRAEVDGVITGLRFYKGAQNTGPHIGNLWTSTGTQLTSVTFTNETASGWQQVGLPTPVGITANTTYVVSYHTTVGRFAYNAAYFTAEYVNAPLRAPASGVSGGNGVYKYGASGFPDQTYNANNYWVDVVFDTTGSPPPPDTTAPTVSGVVPAAGATGVSTGTVALTPSRGATTGV